MKYFIVKYQNEKLCHKCLVLPNTDYHNPIFVDIDFFVGCCFAFPEDSTQKEIEDIMNGMVGTVVEMTGEMTLHESGIFLANQNNII